MKKNLMLAVSMATLMVAVTLASASQAAAQGRPVPDRKPREIQPVTRPTPEPKLTERPKDLFSDYLEQLLKLSWMN